MNNDEEILKKRFRDLADKAYSRNICMFSNFLGLLELSTFYEISKDFSYVPYELFGGTDFCERKIIRFGEALSPYPIACIHIKPSLKKFSDNLTHRDFLGALVNLGIKRETLGDIIIKDNEAFVFCLENISEFIIQNLDRIKHTSVKCAISDNIPDKSYITIKKLEYNVASLRLDAVIAELCNLSRSQAQAILREKKVFINGRLNENNSYNLKPQDAITVRGYGRFIFGEEIRTTKKGRFYVSVDKYI